MKKIYLVDGGQGVKSIELPQYPNSAWEWAGGDPEEAITDNTLYSTVAAVFRAVNISADAISNIPFALVSKRGKDIDTSQKWENKVGFLPHPRELIRMWRLSLMTTNTAYGYIDKVRGVETLRYIAPTTITPVVDSKDGVIGFKRKIGSTEQYYAVDDKRFIYLWRLDHTTELLPSKNTELKAMMSSAGILFYADHYIESFFRRGGIKPTMLSVTGVPDAATRERIENAWDKIIRGFYKYLGKVFNAQTVEPKVIGEGVEELADEVITRNKLEAIAMAAGMPLSLLLSNSANYATAVMEFNTWFRNNIVPWCSFIADGWNDSLWHRLGYHFEFRPEQSDQGQEEDVVRSEAYSNYVTAGILPSVAAQIVGIDLPSGMSYDELDKMRQQNVVQVVQQPVGEQEKEKEDEKEDEDEPMEKKTFIPSQATAVKFVPTLDQYSELDLWRTMAFRRLKRGDSLEWDFQAKTVPENVANIIRERMKKAGDESGIKEAFEEIFLPPTDNSEMSEIAEALNRIAGMGTSGTKAVKASDDILDRIQITVPVTVQAQMPEQAAPVVNVNVPETVVPAPIVNVSPTPVTVTNNVETPRVTVQVPASPQPQVLKVNRDADGKIVTVERK